jgi:3-oxoacyl-[acyl-carrier protein] reductase
MSKNILITGASSGVGFATANLFAEQGHRVYALARNQEGLNELISKRTNSKGEIIPILFDLTNFNKQELKTATNHIPHIDILINNAGIIINKPFLEITEQELFNVTDINYIAVVKLIQVLHNKLIKAQKPHIINISSVGGITRTVKFPGLSTYSSSKGALSILSECLAEEFKDDNIKVNCLALGAVNTKMLKNAFPDYTAQVNPMQIAEYICNFSLYSAEVLNGQTQIISLTTP